MHFSSNGSTTNVVHHDLDLYFQGHESEMSEIVKARTIIPDVFIDIDICHRMAPL